MAFSCMFMAFLDILGHFWRFFNCPTLWCPSFKSHATPSKPRDTTPKPEAFRLRQLWPRRQVAHQHVGPSERPAKPLWVAYFHWLQAVAVLRVSTC